jgi:type II secretory ATPase GspE/PulE/Tfp pilus assembly ATPase PilB-like protein
LKRPEGIIVVTGPTGSGKTTTLYSMLSFINSIDVNIMTLEDPVEYQFPLIRQTNVREGVIDFQSGYQIADASGSGHYLPRGGAR